MELARVVSRAEARSLALRQGAAERAVLGRGKHAVEPDGIARRIEAEPHRGDRRRIDLLEDETGAEMRRIVPIAARRSRGRRTLRTAAQALEHGDAAERHLHRTPLRRAVPAHRAGVAVAEG